MLLPQTTLVRIVTCGHYALKRFPWTTTASGPPEHIWHLGVIKSRTGSCSDDRQLQGFGLCCTEMDRQCPSKVFNGAAIYKAKTLLSPNTAHCRYKDLTLGRFTCEHVRFHQCLAQEAYACSSTRHSAHTAMHGTHLATVPLLRVPERHNEPLQHAGRKGASYGYESELSGKV